MKYALNLAEDGRILSACFANKYTPDFMPRVDELPEGDVTDYLYVGGEFVYDPLPVPDTALRASANYEVGKVFVEDGNLFRAIESISAHERIIPGANCETVTIADALNALNKEE